MCTKYIPLSGCFKKWTNRTDEHSECYTGSQSQVSDVTDSVMKGVNIIKISLQICVFSNLCVAEGDEDTVQL